MWVLLGLLFLLGCTDRNPEGAVVARINDYQLTLKEFETRLAADMEMDPEFKLTQQAKKTFLDQLIQRELLIQEAMKLKLDRRDQFIQAIERYWQSTLIRDLLELKGKEIEKQTYISEEEVMLRYQQMKADDETLPPLEKIRADIIQHLKEEKKTEKLKKWIETLREKATIEINQELIQEKNR